MCVCVCLSFATTCVVTVGFSLPAYSGCLEVICSSAEVKNMWRFLRHDA